VAPLLFALGVIAAFALAIPSAPPPPPPRPVLPLVPVDDEDFGPLLAAGAQAPDFEVERLGGGSVRLSSLQGRVVLLDFWATWCPPCRAEMPWLVRLGASYESRGLTLVALSQDNPPDQRALVARYAEEVPGLARFAALGTHDVGRVYGAESLPTLYLLDRKGRVVDIAVGSRPEAAVRAAVDRALAAP
jgi:thiol-disulfide isomerase/thioredoxin